MTIEQQVVSFDLAKRLKELGVKQESLFYWASWKSISSVGTGLEIRDKVTVKHNYPQLIDYDCSAFTVAELGEMLPSNCVSYRTNEEEDGKNVNNWLCCQYVDGDWSKYHNIIPARNEADARAKMLIYLIENKVIAIPPEAAGKGRSKNQNLTSMDLQTILNGQMAKIRQERLEGSDQLLLGELKLKLEAIGDKSKPIEFDFGMKPAGAGSWRGSYRELGLEYSTEGGGSAEWNSDEVEWESDDGEYKSYKKESFEMPQSPSVRNFLDMLNALTDKTMVGYKGGDFVMSKNVAVYLSNYGQSEVPDYKGKESATVAPFDVVENEGKVVIVTESVEY